MKGRGMLLQILGISWGYMSKMELTQEQDLKLYIFAGGNFMPPTVDALHGNMAFTLEQAQQKLIESRRGMPVIGFTFCGTIPIQDILEKIDETEIEIDPKVEFKTELEFIHGLKLAADTFCREEKDQRSLKRLLTKIEKSLCTS